MHVNRIARENRRNLRLDDKNCRFDWFYGMELRKKLKPIGETHAICSYLSIARSVRCSFGAKREAIVQLCRFPINQFQRASQNNLPYWQTQTGHSIVLRSEQWFCPGESPDAFYLEERRRSTFSVQQVTKWRPWTAVVPGRKLKTYCVWLRRDASCQMKAHALDCQTCWKETTKLRTKKKRNTKDENPNRSWSCAEVRKSESILAPNWILKCSIFPARLWKQPIRESMEQKMP